MYWLPPGHTAAHADSEPLGPAAAGDLRLPYQAVFVAFADPLLFPPTNPASDEAHRQRLRRSVGSMPAPDDDPGNLTWSRQLNDTVVTAEDAQCREDTFAPWTAMLRHHGAAVEGLLLLADSDGTPRDEFIWSLAVSDPESGRILDRDVIPASRARTAHRAVIDNMIAVVGWADWHSDREPPPTSTGQPRSNDPAWEQLGDLGSNVFVLDPRGQRRSAVASSAQDSG